MNKKGFTLIEVLAIIIILSIIAVITVPIIGNVIQTSRENAFIDTGYGLVKSAQTYQLDKQRLNEDYELSVNYMAGENKNSLKTKGKLPDAGELKINSKGKVAMAIWSDSAKVCVVKGYKAKKVVINRSLNKDDCKISNIIDLPVIQSWGSNSTTDFHNEVYRTKIKSVEILDTKTVPDNAVASWDVSEKKNKSVMAYVINDPNNAGYYKLYIGGDEGVKANPILHICFIILQL